MTFRLLLCLFAIGWTVVSATRIPINDRVTYVFHNEAAFQMIMFAPEYPNPMVPRPSLVVGEAGDVGVTTTANGTSMTLTTSAIVVVVDTVTGVLISAKSLANPLMVLSQSNVTFTPTANASLYNISTRFTSNAESEKLYGGGEFANGLIDYHQVSLQMIQFNTEAVVPFFVSTAGYGIYMDQYSRSWLNPPSDEDQVEMTAVSSTEYFGSYTVQDDGPVYVFYNLSRGWGGKPPVLLMVGDQVCSNYTSHYHPDSMSCRIFGLSKGKTYPIVASIASGTIDIYIRSAGSGNVFASENERSINMFLVFPTPNSPTMMDGLVSQYRSLTGSAPMLGLWAYGFWQCRERYHSRDEILTAASTFRQRKLPVDNIVQDWQYWGGLGWGPQWDPQIFPDPSSMVETLHNLSFHYMVSVWSKFDVNTTFWDEMSYQNLGINNSIYLDIWNDKAQAMFYEFANESMFKIGVDAIWADATEPENLPNMGQSTALGTGDEYLNTYSLLVMKGASQRYNVDYPNKRFFSLTRSSFAGQQRYNGILWSGDISSTWEDYNRQIPESLNYALSGVPYWSEDIGGFFRPSNQYDDPLFHELLVRWFQFGAFTPIFRVHGYKSNTEYWNYGPETEQLMLGVDNLRYRLLPYIYSCAWMITNNSYTLQRHFVFDFLHDKQAVAVTDQYMFGPSIMVAPVLSLYARDRMVYLPALSQGRGWVDFWSGQTNSGNQTLSFQAPMTHLPLNVPQGSIVVMGPFLQYSNEKPMNPLEVRVYPGADSCFDMYEDDGITRDYLTKKSYSTYTICWDDSSSAVSVSAREGGYAGFVKELQMDIVIVKPGFGTGLNVTATPSATLIYKGSAISQHIDGYDTQVGSVQ
eukprot:m.203462 g.203462  ORF g.203462 m.203462 type:complete len:862 (+) comp17073_c0_seq4:1611-4196(+)